MDPYGKKGPVMRSRTPCKHNPNSRDDDLKQGSWVYIYLIKGFGVKTGCGVPANIHVRQLLFLLCGSLPLSLVHVGTPNTPNLKSVMPVICKEPFSSRF